MRRILLSVSYDGTNYCGFQIQKNGDTIAGQLNRHLSDLLNEPVRVMGASRTDAGVHALGNVAVFDTNARMKADRIAFAMNTRLPEDIRVQFSCEVPPEFHPRFQETIKTYEYKIWNRRFPDPTKRLYTLHYHWKLDETRMQRAADVLVGTHDFSSLCTHKPDVTDHVRTIYELKVTREGGMVTIRITGNGFLYNMVRIITGTLLRIGQGLMEPDEMKTILESKDRSMAAETARPEGLTLVRIRYPAWEGLIPNNPDL